MKPIVTVPAVVLTSPAKPVIRFDNWLKKLVADMKSTLKQARNPRGVGLAAPQIGIGYRIFLIAPKSGQEPRVFINPTITDMEPPSEKASKDEEGKLEGCLSIPRVWGDVRRSRKLTITFQDETGSSHTETVTGFPAVIIQHEIDHLNGILFTHRVLEQKGKLYEPGRDDHGKEILQELEL
jgi:peptide deformylase